MKKINHCPICRSNKIKNIKDHLFKYPGDNLRDHLDDINFERLWILFNTIIEERGHVIFNSTLCQNCGFIFINPRFSNEEMALKYATITKLKGVKFRLEHDRLTRQARRSKSIYSFINQYIIDAKIKFPRIVDIGGASGYILESFVKNYDCSIIDFEKWELPKGIKYIGEDLSKLKNDQKFDVALLLHTLEHIVEPRNIFKSIRKNLNENGFLYVEVPLGVFQEWKYISDPLTHVNFFSEFSLVKLFEEFGFNVIYLSTAYQRVTRAKTWCINILATKKNNLQSIPSESILSTKQQMNKLRYYLPFIFHKRAYKKILKKLLN